VNVLSVSDALALVLADAGPLPAAPANLLDAHGCVLAADVVARRTQPPGSVSAMDGYAVNGADVERAPARLKVIGEVAAGRPFERVLARGEAARIFTGGVLPAGADTVAIQEVTAREGDMVTVSVATPRGRNVRLEGLDFRAGDVLLAKGRQLTSRDLALAAAMNHPTLNVHRRPRVAVLATGDELVPPGTAPGPSQIVHSNGYALLTLARAEGAEIIDLGIVADRLDDTVAAVRRARAAGADVLVTTGGVSVGDYDLVRPAFAAEGMAMSFWRVAMRPGRPLMHGRLEAMHVLGLPGNPVSAFVCGLLFLVPLLRTLIGRGDVDLALESATLGRDLPANDERTDYLRAGLSRGADGALVATPFEVQDSSMVGLLAKADCMVVRGPYAPSAKAGSTCAIVKLGL